MRVAAFAPLLAALSSVASAIDMHHPNRMVRKRIPTPLIKELHLTSEDSNGNDALSPVTDTFQTETFSEEFDKGHLTGPGSFLQSHQISGPDSVLQSDEVHLSPGDSGTSLDYPLTDPTSLSSVTGNLGNGAGIIAVRRGLFDMDSSELEPDVPDVTDQESQAEGGLPLSAGPVGLTGFGGRLRGKRVRRMTFDNVVPAAQDLDITFLQSEAAADLNTFTAHGSPYQAAKLRNGDVMGLGELGLRK